MARPKLQLQFAHSPVLRYGLAVLSVCLALGGSLLLGRFHFRNVADPLFLIAIATTVWYAEIGPAVLAIVLSGLADTYFFIEPLYSIYITREDVLHFVIFMLFATLLTGFAAVRRRVEGELRQARDNLQIQVAERTQQASLLNLKFDSVFVRNMDFVITCWNLGAQDLYGWAAEDAIGKRCHELLQTAFPAPHEDLHAELLGTGRWQGSSSAGRALTTNSQP
jgi:PAS domain-containing protein